MSVIEVNTCKMSDSEIKLKEGSESYYLNEKERSITHQDALKIVKKSLGQILKNDPLMCDLSPDITADEVDLQIALEHGQAMTVNIIRGDDQIPIVIQQDTKVIDLKHAIKAAILRKQKREGGTQCISWKYVWKRYWLYFDNQKLSEDFKKLKDYGIKNRDNINFIKKLRNH